MRDFWLEQGPAEVLSKLQRKEVTLFRAAEMLNVTVTTLANYLSTLRQGDGASSGSDGEGEEEREHDRLASARQALSSNPDITIVKREAPILASLNGNKWALYSALPVIPALYGIRWCFTGMWVESKKSPCCYKVGFQCFSYLKNKRRWFAL